MLLILQILEQAVTLAGRNQRLYGSKILLNIRQGILTAPGFCKIAVGLLVPGFHAERLAEFVDLDALDLGEQGIEQLASAGMCRALIRHGGRRLQPLFKPCFVLPVICQLCCHIGGQLAGGNQQFALVARRERLCRRERLIE